MISEEEYDRITQALVIRLRQHEETVNKDSKLQQHSSIFHTVHFSLQLLKLNTFFPLGSELPGIRQKELIRWYIDQQNEKKKYSSQEQVKLDIKKLRAIIEVIIQNKHISYFQMMFLSNTSYALRRVWYVKKVIL